MKTWFNDSAEKLLLFLPFYCGLFFIGLFLLLLLLFFLSLLIVFVFQVCSKSKTMKGTYAMNLSAEMQGKS